MFREEEAWLKEVLDKKPTDQCVIAVWHHPVCGGTDICDDFMNSIWRLLQGKAGLVVTGHEHAYRRYLKMDGDRKPSPAGLLQITVGTGGSQNIFQFSERHAFTDRTAPEPCASSYGVLLLRLRGRVGEFEFVPWSAKDRPLVFDHGAFSCPTDK